MFTSADVIFRIDEFAVIQDGIYAYDSPTETTITGRDDRDDKSIAVNRKMQIS